MTFKGLNILKIEMFLFDSFKTEQKPIRKKRKLTKSIDIHLIPYRGKKKKKDCSKVQFHEQTRIVNQNSQLCIVFDLSDYEKCERMVMMCSREAAVLLVYKMLHSECRCGPPEGGQLVLRIERFGYMPTYWPGSSTLKHLLLSINSIIVQRYLFKNDFKTLFTVISV